MSEPPEFLRLAGAGLVYVPTVTALASRLEPRDSTDPKYLDRAAFAVLVALCDRLRPPFPRPSALDVALHIDDRLAAGLGDGWRYDAMPPDGEATARGLQALDAEARRICGRAFTELSGDEADVLLSAVRVGNVLADWDGVPPARLFEELLVEIVTFAYAHPDTQAAIGYVGYADARGWTRIGLNEREPWE